MNTKLISNISRAKFLFKVPNARMLRNQLPKSKVQEHDYVVERAIYLSKPQFVNFREHLLDDDANIKKYKNDMFIDENGVWHVLMFCSLRCDTILIVNSEGFDYARYCSMIFNKGEQVEKRFSIKYRKY